jgi:hypothetical protein
MAEQNKLVLAVTPENWQEVLSELQDRSGFSDFVWLDCAEVDIPDLGPIAVTKRWRAAGQSSPMTRGCAGCPD